MEVRVPDKDLFMERATSCISRHKLRLRSYLLRPGTGMEKNNRVGAVSPKPKGNKKRRGGSCFAEEMSR